MHSLKDLPTAQHPDLVLAAIPSREDPRDVLIAREGLALDRLPEGARVGTGSPRRMAQLHAYARNHGLDITCVPIRGNVDTRVGYVRAGELDAVVLAAAGCKPHNVTDERLRRSLPPSRWPSTPACPPPARRALAVECLSVEHRSSPRRWRTSVCGGGSPRWRRAIR
ncbi:hydroxymethylbilane synthase [Streptomyces tanashiensis]